MCPNDGSSLHDSADDTDLVGSVIADRYHIKAKLGQGGMGAVYLAEHVRMGQEVAIKVASRQLASDPEAIARFTREARNAARIKHPNVCGVHDFGETSSGLVYLAMEYVEGGSLSDMLREAGTLPLEQAADIITQCCDALQAAHELDIVHRDIKPDNIMITERRDGTVAVKLVDFGIAKAFTPEEGQTVTKTGFIVGTPDYMSPEQVSGTPLDGRSDVYSLALVLFRMLTDRLPFEGDTPQGVLMGRLTSPPLKLAEVLPQRDLPAQLQVVLDRALERECERRYATATGFGQAVAAAVQSAKTIQVETAPSIEQAAAAETEVIDTTGQAVRLGETPTPETPQPIAPLEKSSRRSGLKLAVYGSVGVAAVGLAWVIVGSGMVSTGNGMEERPDSTSLGTPAGVAEFADSKQEPAGDADVLASSAEPATTDSGRVGVPQTRAEPEGSEGRDPAPPREQAPADSTPDELVLAVPVSEATPENADRAAEWTSVEHGLTTAELEGIWGGPTNLWVVGGNGTLLHYDGTAWSHAISLEQARELGSRLESASLQALWGSAPDDVWAVGMAILHYDGTAWSDATPEMDLEWLRAIWGGGADDIWAVGNRGAIVHYDRGAWVDVSGDLTGEDLLGVWGSGQDDVWAVGEGGIILHYDGTSWTDVTPGLGTRWLNAIWGSAQDDVWAVGNSGTMLRYDGSAWSDVAPLRRRSNGEIGPAVTWDIYGISGRGPNDIWIATNGPIYHYDGETWTNETPDGVYRLYNIRAAGPADVWAIGWWGEMLHLSR